MVARDLPSSSRLKSRPARQHRPLRSILISTALSDEVGGLGARLQARREQLAIRAPPRPTVPFQPHL